MENRGMFKEKDDYFAGSTKYKRRQRQNHMLKTFCDCYRNRDRYCIFALWCWKWWGKRFLNFRFIFWLKGFFWSKIRFLIFKKVTKYYKVKGHHLNLQILFPHREMFIIQGHHLEMEYHNIWSKLTCALYFCFVICKGIGNVQLKSGILDL